MAPASVWPMLACRWLVQSNADTSHSAVHGAAAVIVMGLLFCWVVRDQALTQGSLGHKSQLGLYSEIAN